MNCGLEFLREEFSENISASTSAMSFLVASVYFFVKCLWVIGWGFPGIFLIILQIVLVLVEEPSWLTVLQTFLLGFLNEFSCSCLEEFEVIEISDGKLLIKFT